MKKIYIVQIEWLDSVQNSVVWYEPDEAIKYSENSDVFKSVGYLLKKGKRHTVVASSLHIENGKVIKAGTILTIPTGCILKIKKL